MIRLILQPSELLKASLARSMQAGSDALNIAPLLMQLLPSTTTLETVKNLLHCRAIVQQKC